MAIQHRRGVYNRFDPTKLLPGEWAIVLNDDPTASDGRAAYICFAAGAVKRIATFEDMAQNIADANEQLIEQLTASVNTATTAATNATNAANTAASTANSAASTANNAASSAATAATAASTAAANEQQRISNETARQNAEQTRQQNEQQRITNENARVAAEEERAATEIDRISAEEDREDAEAARQLAETGRVTAEGARDVAEAARVAEFEEMKQRSKGWLRYYCGEGEYSTTTGEPRISDPDMNTLYFVPQTNATEENQWVEWFWDASGSGRWERMGTTEAQMYPVDTTIIDNVVADDAPSGSEVLTTTGLSYLWVKLKAAFASLVHTHDASDIIQGTLPVNRGGTGAGSASGALTNLGAAAASHTHAAADINSGQLAIANGGTGATTAAAARTALGAASQTDLQAVQDSVSTVTQATTISDICSAQDGVTISAATYANWGKIASLSITFSLATALAVGNQVTLGQIVNGKRPLTGTTIGSSRFVGHVVTNGKIYIRNVQGSQLNADTNVTVFATYMLT